MSQERRNKQVARGPKPPTDYRPLMRKGAIFGAIAALVLIAWYFAMYRPSHKLDAFAKCLTQNKAHMYGAFWCPHCQDQKEKFEASFEYVNYTECGIQGARGITQQCKDVGIQRFPTWFFGDNEKREAVLSLEDLSQKTGCPLP
jgi:hypothetical protein